ncbi:MAG: chromate transporter [Eubacteriales bacterium]|nr:chromate transporter [Eubacteriales bacterium]
MEKKEPKKHVLPTLFFATLYLSAFTFGGGYVIVSLLKNKFVDQYHWIDIDEMLDLVAIAQSSPGAIAVNGAIVVGYKLAGIAGVIVSVLGAILPPMIIISIVSYFYTIFSTNTVIAAMLSGMKAGVGAVITSVVYDMGKGIVKSHDIINICVMVISFCVNYFLGINVIFIILSVGSLGFARALIHEKKEGKC